MKNAVILHGTDGNSQGGWFPWLSDELKSKGYKVWVPNLPDADKPDVCKYNPFLFDGWEYNIDTILIGHSSGAAAILNLLNKFPEDKKIDTAILVAGFTDNLNWDKLDDLFQYPLDWKKIKRHARRFILVHSDDDPYVDIKYGKQMQSKLGGELIVVKGQKHFSVSTGGEKFRKLPIILEILKKNE